MNDNNYKIRRAMSCKYCLSVGKGCFGKNVYVKCNPKLTEVKYIEGVYDTPTRVLTLDKCYDCDLYEEQEE